MSNDKEKLEEIFGKREKSGEEIFSDMVDHIIEREPPEWEKYGKRTIVMGVEAAACYCHALRKIALVRFGIDIDPLDMDRYTAIMLLHYLGFKVEDSTNLEKKGEIIEQNSEKRE